MPYNGLPIQGGKMGTRTTSPRQRVRLTLHPSEVGRESLLYVERRLLNASSLHSKLRTLGNPVADDAMVDVLGMCLYASPFEILILTIVLSFFVRDAIFISAWASKLLI